jgi:hypothetical protein
MPSMLVMLHVWPDTLTSPKGGGMYCPNSLLIMQLLLGFGERAAWNAAY